MLDVYAQFAEEQMAMPVIKGEKTAGERFPGAVSTLTMEAMMQDRRALQAGTSHFLGQNFARASNIKFQSEAGKEEYAWTTILSLSTAFVAVAIAWGADGLAAHFVNGMDAALALAYMTLFIAAAKRLDHFGNHREMPAFWRTVRRRLLAIRFAADSAK